MHYLWFALGFAGFLILDGLLNGDWDAGDDDGGGERRPDGPAPRTSGDSMPISLDEVELGGGAGRVTA